MAGQMQIGPDLLLLLPQLGTAVIRGRVLGADNGRPLRRARFPKVRSD